MKKVFIRLFFLLFLISLTACSNNIELVDLQGTWVRVDGYTIDEEDEVVSLDIVDFTVSENEVSQNSLTEIFELEGYQIALASDDLISFNYGENVLSLDSGILTVNEVNYFLQGTTAYENHLEEWQVQAGDSLYEMFGEIWAWRAEVEEVVNDLSSAFDEAHDRVAIDVLEQLIGYTWTAEVPTGDLQSHAFLEDGRVISFSPNFIQMGVGVSYFENVEIINLNLAMVEQLDLNLTEDFWLVDSSGATLSINEITPPEPNLPIEEQFSIFGTRDFTGTSTMVETTLMIRRDLESDTPENRLFLEELVRLAEQLRAYSTYEIIEFARTASFWGRWARYSNAENPFWRGVTFGIQLVDEDYLLFGGHANFISISEGETGFWIDRVGFFERTPNDYDLIESLLTGTELEPQEVVNIPPEYIRGEWVRFEAPDSSNLWNPLGSVISLIIGSNSNEWRSEDEISVSETYNPYLCASGFQGSVHGGERQHFQLSDSGAYIILGERMIGMHSDMGEVGTSISFELFTDILVFDGVTYFRLGSETYYHYRSQFSEQLALVFENFDLTPYLGRVTQEAFDACLVNSEFLN